MGKINEFFGWLKVSNRPKHVKAGITIVLVMVLSAALLELIGAGRFLIDSLLISEAVLVAMMSVEFIQQSSGVGKWDWLDVLAGCLPAVVLLAVSLLISLFV